MRWFTQNFQFFNLMGLLPSFPEVGKALNLDQAYFMYAVSSTVTDNHNIL